MEIMLFVQYQVKLLNLEELNYWNVDLQEAILIHIKRAFKKEKLNKNRFISIDYETKSTVQDFLKSFFLAYDLNLSYIFN